MSTREAALAATRFGLGARPGELDAIAGDPRGWLLAQLEPQRPPDPELQGLPPSSVILASLAEQRRASEDGRKALREAQRDAYRGDVSVRCKVAARTDAPFRERLVAFWSNHFTVSAERREVLGLAGAHEREAVRPHAVGRFEDMLVASTRHPAMLAYLDQFKSIGPNSLAGARSGRGLNENLARELLELHTLGVDGGYGQPNVEALAQILTGWSFERRPGRSRRMGDEEVTGRYGFEPRMHEPGTKELLGAYYPGNGEEDGLAALSALAAHPSTAEHVATKLVRHFVADEPPPAAVERVASAFRDSDGDLGVTAAAVVEAPEAWAQGSGKVKTPYDLVLSSARLLGYTDDGRPLAESMGHFGQAPFRAPSPQGWSDRAADWIHPQGVLDRIEWARDVAEASVERIGDVADLAHGALGPLLSRRTLRALRSAAEPTTALALLLASPEFHRR